jgi:L-ascorbate metabolism protein UlaG (beta-lactamase superfamily)
MIPRTGLILIVPILFLLAACGGPSQKKSTEAAPTPTASTAAAPTEITGITLTYGDNAQVELVTPAGRHVYIDIWNTSFLTKQPAAEDVLLTTHGHSDHYDKSFADSFPGQKIIMAMGEIQLPDIAITAMASAHLPTDPINPDKATNYLFLIQMGGLRIVHFGDIGQDALTDEQLQKIGTVDLAITQFSNSFSLMNADNRKGINLMNQIKPRLIIPTHSDRATLEIAVGLWQGFYSESRTVAILQETLPAGTSILFLGDENLLSAYVKIFNLKEWK